MQLDSITAMAIAVWVAAACTAGIAVAGNLRTLSGGRVLAGVAVLSPLVMMWRWNDPRPHMSDGIHEARR